jgi:hypothetical protein
MGRPYMYGMTPADWHLALESLCLETGAKIKKPCQACLLFQLVGPSVEERPCLLASS